MPFDKRITELLQKRNKKIYEEYVFNGRTLNSIAVEYDLSKERIRQIVQEIIRKEALAAK